MTQDLSMLRKSGRESRERRRDGAAANYLTFLSVCVNLCKPI
jgi:hypothetical protein